MQQQAGCDRDAGRQCPVLQVAAANEDRFAVLTGVVQSAVGIAEQFEHLSGQLPGFPQPAAPEIGEKEFHQAQAEKGVVFEKGGDGGFTIAVAAQQTAIVPAQVAQHEVGGPAGRLEQLGPVEGGAGPGEGGDGQAVPACQQLFVPMRADAAGADLQQLCPDRGEAGIFGVIPVQGENVAPLEIAGRGHAEGPDGQLGFRRRQLCADGSLVPEVEGALGAFGVGVLTTIEPAFGVLQLSQQVIGGLNGDAGKEGATALAAGTAGGEHQQRLVVEHLFEMRHQPPAVDRVAVDAEADLVVDASETDGAQGFKSHVPGLVVAETAGQAQQQFEVVGRGEPGWRAEAGMDRVPDVAVLVQCPFQQGFPGRSGDVTTVSDLFQCSHHPVGTEQQPSSVDVPHPPYFRQYLDQSRLAVACSGRQVGGGKEGPPVGSEQQGERPAATSGHQLADRQVGGVDVRALFPVDLDGDEMSVDQVGDLLVFEGFAGHDVAPVAGGVADGEQHRAIAPAGLPEGLIRPWVPVDRIGGVLAQVGALFEDQAVEVRAAVGRQGRNLFVGQGEGGGLRGVTGKGHGAIIAPLTERCLPEEGLQEKADKKGPREGGESRGQCSSAQG